MASRQSNLAEVLPVSEQEDLVIHRVFNAPREKVWKAWTDPESLKQWWGPKGFTTPVATLDLEVGGRYLNCMRSPEGRDYWSTGVYREISAPERLVVTDSFADENGKVVPATDYGLSEDFPLELSITLTLEERRGRTKLSLRHEGIPPGRDFDDCLEGWNQMLDKLEEFLAKA